MSRGAQKSRITYMFDAYSGWCYGFGPALTQFVQDNADAISLAVLCGGLFTGKNRSAMSAIPSLRANNAAVADETGAIFGAEYARLVSAGDFVMDSADAAVGFAALRREAVNRDSGPVDLELATALQHAFYREGKSLSDPETYRSIADSFDLDSRAVVTSLFSADTVDAAQRDMSAARRLGARSFPTLLLHREDGMTTRFGLPSSSASDLTREFLARTQASEVS